MDRKGTAPCSQTAAPSLSLPSGDQAAMRFTVNLLIRNAVLAEGLRSIADDVHVHEAHECDWRCVEAVQRSARETLASPHGKEKHVMPEDKAGRRVETGDWVKTIPLTYGAGTPIIGRVATLKEAQVCTGTVVWPSIGGSQSDYFNVGESELVLKSNGLPPDDLRRGEVPAHGAAISDRET